MTTLPEELSEVVQVLDLPWGDMTYRRPYTLVFPVTVGPPPQEYIERRYDAPWGPIGLN